MRVEPNAVSGRFKRVPVIESLAKLPYWLLFFILMLVLILWGFINDQNYLVIFRAVTRGIWTTVYVSAVAFTLAIVFGLMLSLMRIYRNRFFQQVSSFYIEIMRGVPMLVLLMYISFVFAPALVTGYNQAASPLIESGLLPRMDIRKFDFTVRAILALVMAYSAFIAETFRAGILSIEKEQTEAAQVEGASNWQVMWYVILPQAVRNILPALGNDLIAMLKDSSLVSVLGVQDITQLGKLYASSTFLFFETYNVVAFLYLTMTLGLAMVVRGIEKRLNPV